MSYLPEVLSEYFIDFSKELSIEQFLPYGFYKIASSTLKSKKRFESNPDVNPIDYIPVSEHLDKYKEYCELIYILTIDSKIAKIGGTYVGMKGRHQSYNCGTRKARKSGTCSVTNFNVTEVQYASLMNGKSVDWYVYEVPIAKTILNVWGEEIEYNSKTFYKYESSLCEQYKKLTGHYPLLSTNFGVE